MMVFIKKNADKTPDSTYLWDLSVLPSTYPLEQHIPFIDLVYSFGFISRIHDTINRECTTLCALNEQFIFVSRRKGPRPQENRRSTPIPPMVSNIELIRIQMYASATDEMVASPPISSCSDYYRIQERDLFAGDQC
jgi:hypothetical protein